MTMHLDFMKSRRNAAGSGYRELIRLLKAWVRESKRVDEDLRCKSFLIELIVAHLWDIGWNGGNLLQSTTIRERSNRFFRTWRGPDSGEPVVFADFYPAGDVQNG